MKILIVAATAFEIAPFLAYLDRVFSKRLPKGGQAVLQEARKEGSLQSPPQLGTGNPYPTPTKTTPTSQLPEKQDYLYSNKKLDISIAITGVGMSQTSYTLGRIFALEGFDLAINAGVAGAFSERFQNGTVVHVISERFGDLGVEEADGHFTDMHELGLLPLNEFPFQEGELLNIPAAQFNFLPHAKGLTVNKVHGFAPSIKAIQKKYNADIETMEGAAFFQACLMAKIPFLEIRAISNKVESRNRANWEIELAINNLGEVLKRVVETLGE